MNKFTTEFNGLPVVASYNLINGCVDLVAVEWRDIELQDAMTEQEKAIVTADIAFDLPVDREAVEMLAWQEWKSDKRRSA